jgi:hypothetical protein
VCLAKSALCGARLCPLLKHSDDDLDVDPDQQHQWPNACWGGRGVCVTDLVEYIIIDVNANARPCLFASLEMLYELDRQ